MSTVVSTFTVDVCNYFSLEALEKMGIESPDQQQIDAIAETIKKVILLTTLDARNGNKINSKMKLSS